MNKKPIDKKSDMPKSLRYFDPLIECYCRRCGSYYDGVVVEIEAGKDDYKLWCPVCGTRVDEYSEGEERGVTMAK